MMPMNPDKAEVVGLQALGWLVGQEELLPVFLGSTGASEADIKSRATDPEFLGSVLDFLLMDDAWITGFCDALSLQYDTPLRARAGLPGGAQVNWT